MRVLQINLSDYNLNGGTGIAMHRLHSALRGTGVDSKILCSLKTLDHSQNIVKIPRSVKLKIAEKLIKNITLQLGLNDIHSLNSFDVIKNQVYLDADILNLHCIHEGFFSYLALPSLTKSKPAVFTLHDMWAFTGHCAYSYDCDRWKIGCGKCPYPETSPSIKRDGTYWEWQLKDWAYSNSNLAIVTPSSWMTEQAKQSMLNRFPIHHIPYGLDTNTYQPLDPEACRLLLGIPTAKKVLMFAAEKLNDPRKGGDLILKVLQRLPESLKAETVLLLLGGNGEVIAELTGFQTLNLGYLNHARLMTIAYSAADLLLFPSRDDNLPLILQESMACGTPMVSFKVGGVPDLVRPGITGYLAEAENVEDFRDGIIQLLDDEPLRNYMSQQCRKIAVKEYSLELYVHRYLDLYRQLLQKGVSQTESALVSCSSSRTDYSC